MTESQQPDEFANATSSLYGLVKGGIAKTPSDTTDLNMEDCYSEYAKGDALVCLELAERSRERDG